MISNLQIGEDNVPLAARSLVQELKLQRLNSGHDLATCAWPQGEPFLFTKCAIPALQCPVSRPEPFSLNLDLQALGFSNLFLPVLRQKHETSSPPWCHLHDLHIFLLVSALGQESSLFLLLHLRKTSNRRPPARLLQGLWQVASLQASSPTSSSKPEKVLNNILVSSFSRPRRCWIALAVHFLFRPRPQTSKALKVSCEP